MRFYKHSHAFYAGVDLHARSMIAHLRAKSRARSKRFGRPAYSVRGSFINTLSSLGNKQGPEPVELFGAVSVLPRVDAVA
jgi:hypothetical protein